MAEGGYEMCCCGVALSRDNGITQRRRVGRAEWVLEPCGGELLSICNKGSLGVGWSAKRAIFAGQERAK